MKTALIGLLAALAYIWIVCKNYNFESGLAKQPGSANRMKVAFGALSADRRTFAIFAVALMVSASSFVLLFATRPKQAEPAMETITLPLAVSQDMPSSRLSTPAPDARVMQEPRAPAAPKISRISRPIFSPNRGKSDAKRTALFTPVLGTFDGRSDSSRARTLPVPLTDNTNTPQALPAVVQGHAGLRVRFVRSASRFCRWSSHLIITRIYPRKRSASAPPPGDPGIAATTRKNAGGDLNTGLTE